MQQKVAVVTGSAQGIGRDYALSLASDGMAVVVADIKIDGARDTAATIVAAGGRALAVEVDVSSVESAAAMAEAVRKEFGTAHVLVNNAALFQGLKILSPLTTGIDYWRKVMSINLEGVLIVTQALAPLMKPNGWGRVVNQSSTAAYLGRGDAYAVSKLGVIGLTQGLATELGEFGITVNAIAPGPTSTEALREVVPDAMVEGLVSRMAIKRLGQTSDMVGALRFLVSDAAGWMSGQTLVVDGGQQKRI
jgi:3-oxoacyl-[acyl-carrier protein] reductase